MPNPPVETKEEVIAALVDAGFPLNPAQLARLHRARAIRLVASPGLGQGKGRQSLYASGTIQQAIRLAALASRERRLPERAWLSWWLYGGPISGAAAEFLRARALDEFLSHESDELRVDHATQARDYGRRPDLGQMPS